MTDNRDRSIIRGMLYGTGWVNGGQSNLILTSQEISEVWVKTPVPSATYSFGSSSGSTTDVVSTGSNGTSAWVRILDPITPSTMQLYCTISTGTINYKIVVESF